MKKIIVVFLLCCLLIGIMMISNGSGETITMVIYWDGSLQGTYRFVIQGANMTIEEGSRIGISLDDDITSDLFLESSSKNIQLTDNESSLMYVLADEIYKEERNTADLQVDEGLVVGVKYRGKQVHQYYHHNISPAVRALVDECIRLNPIEPGGIYLSKNSGFSLNENVLSMK